MTDTNDDMVSVPEELVKELADDRKEAARYFYSANKTGAGDRNHSWARQLNDCTDRDWSEVAEE